MLLPLAIALLIVGLVALLVWAIRLSRRMSVERDAALAALAQQLGAGPPVGGATTLTGTLSGRSCSIEEIKTVSSGDTDYSARVAVAIDAPISFELYGQQSKLAAAMVGDVEIGDPDFDKWFIVRTSDAAGVARALTPDLRLQFIEWYRNGRLLRAWIRDGRLYAESGRGLQRRQDVQSAGTLLEATCRLADGLERASG